MKKLILTLLLGGLIMTGLSAKEHSKRVQLNSGYEMSRTQEHASRVFAKVNSTFYSF